MITALLQFPVPQKTGEGDSGLLQPRPGTGDISHSPLCGQPGLQGPTQEPEINFGPWSHAALSSSTEFLTAEGPGQGHSRHPIMVLHSPQFRFPQESEGTFHLTWSRKSGLLVSKPSWGPTSSARGGRSTFSLGSPALWRSGDGTTGAISLERKA